MAHIYLLRAIDHSRLQAIEVTGQPGLTQSAKFGDRDFLLAIQREGLGKIESALMLILQRQQFGCPLKKISIWILLEQVYFLIQLLVNADDLG